MRFLRVALTTAAAVAVMASGAFAKSDDVHIYKGDSLSQAGISVGSWGSGLAAESNEKVLTGSKSIKVITQSLYAGGRLDFAEPVPLFKDGIDPKRYVLFTFFFNETQTIDPTGGAGWMWDVEPYTMPIATKVRFVFVGDNGQAVSVEQPTTELDPDDNWVRVAVPLAKFKSVEGLKEFNLKRLLIFTDAKGILFLGEVKLITDNTPIKVDSLAKQTIAVYDEQYWTANASAGISPLKYSWDFNKGNGIQEESTDKVGRYVYTQSGDYTITLTVSDADGLKTPVTVTTDVSVF